MEQKKKCKTCLRHDNKPVFNMVYCYAHHCDVYIDSLACSLYDDVPVF